MDKDKFLNQLHEYQQRSYDVVAGALLEVGAQTADAVKREDRVVVINICRRRMTNVVRKHIVSDDSVVGGGYTVREHGDTDGDYRVERGDQKIERE
jgi:hypothetical protein